MRRDIGWSPVSGLVAKQIVRYGNPAFQHYFVAHEGLDNVIVRVNFRTVPARDRMQREIKRKIHNYEP